MTATATAHAPAPMPDDRLALIEERWASGPVLVDSPRYSPESATQKQDQRDVADLIAEVKRLRAALPGIKERAWDDGYGVGFVDVAGVPPTVDRPAWNPYRGASTAHG